MMIHVMGSALFALSGTPHAMAALGIPDFLKGSSSPTSSPYDPYVAVLLNAVIFLANVAGGLVVGVATLRGILTYLVNLVRAHGEEVPKEAIRLSLGRSLALALEFQLGADILGTALNPSPRDIGVLAAIIILRTLLNFFLQRELREAERHPERAATTAAEDIEQHRATA